MHIKKQRVLTPGPTPLLPQGSLRHAGGGNSSSHRGFSCRLPATFLADLKEVMGTSNDVLILVSSGTGAMEASVQNFSHRAIA